MPQNRAESRATRKGAPSIHVVRARQLLFGGLSGGAAAAALCLIGFGIGAGSTGLVSAALAAAMVLFFYTVGQLVMVAFADAGARTLLAVAMASYTARVVVLGLLLLIFNRHAASWPLDRMAVLITTIAVVAGWLLVEVIVFSRLRIQVFDTDYVPPTREADREPTAS